MDSLVVHLRNYVNGTPDIVDESNLFYLARKSGPTYEAPFPFANASTCPGISSDLPDE